jgi:xanthine dehydrogenase accessory factor
MEQDTAQAIRVSLETGELQVRGNIEEKLTIIEPLFPEPQLIVLGGGHIAKPLVEFAANLGFSVTVIDDRLSFANEARFPRADRVICESFDKCFEKIEFTPYTYVVIVTRGHRHDLTCLRSVVQKEHWAYVGMIGSKKRVKGIINQLLDEGFSQEVLEKVNAPIGLEIGAVTPDEIAISIIAQLISYRRLKYPEQGKKSPQISWTEFDGEVIEELSKGNKDKKALVTVVETKGSVPRKAGAKMLVWPDGRILGSIGGGCCEAMMIRTALDIIREGGYTMQRIDLTGSIAEEEGMVCGGLMKVLIEAL